MDSFICQKFHLFGLQQLIFKVTCRDCDKSQPAENSSWTEVISFHFLPTLMANLICLTCNMSHAGFFSFAIYFFLFCFSNVLLLPLAFSLCVCLLCLHLGKRFSTISNKHRKFNKFKSKSFVIRGKHFRFFSVRLAQMVREFQLIAEI